MSLDLVKKQDQPCVLHPAISTSTSWLLYTSLCVPRYLDSYWSSFSFSLSSCLSRWESFHLKWLLALCVLWSSTKSFLRTSTKTTRGTICCGLSYVCASVRAKLDRTAEWSTCDPTAHLIGRHSGGGSCMSSSVAVSGCWAAQISSKCLGLPCTPKFKFSSCHCSHHGWGCTDPVLGRLTLSYSPKNPSR